MPGPFAPATGGATQAITVSTTSAAVALDNPKAQSARIYNTDATNDAFVAFGGSGVTAVATGSPRSMRIPAKSAMFLRIADCGGFIATISAAGSPVLEITYGADGV